jgi:hypothetical protein
MTMIDEIFTQIEWSASSGMHEPWAAQTGPHSYDQHYETVRHENCLYLRHRKTGECFKVTVDAIAGWPA